MSSITSDTIAAIATARGRAALAIVRLSGPAALAIVSSCFEGRDLVAAATHTAHVGFFSAAGASLDQVVVTVFRAPRSATGEDVVEITCHGGDFASQLILAALLDAGARLAEPGEFSQRAFLNGKLDLAQAEAVADLIHASSSLAHRVSLSHLQGRYSEAISQIRSELIETCALVELELDFAEEDVEFADKERLNLLLEDAERLLSEMLDSYRLGALLRDGVRVVIGGRPNAGKSTLLNALVGRDRAIVSPVPGTTRDEIEAEGEIEGLLFRFIDTAGLRETSDAIEAEGVRRTRRSIEQSDLLLYVFDLAAGLDGEERAFLKRMKQEQPELIVILVGNKLDLMNGAMQEDPLGLPFVRLSAVNALHEKGELSHLRRLLVEKAAGNFAAADSSRVVINQRHRQHLSRSLEAVRSARLALESTASGGDTLSLDLRSALHELGAITGEITNEDVLDQIFSKFCIGK